MEAIKVRVASVDKCKSPYVELTKNRDNIKILKVPIYNRWVVI